MKIWVDADACPKPIKDILFRVAERACVSVIFVSNAYLRLPQSVYIQFIQVTQGPDIADDKIAEECAVGDIVVTADIPLAARVVEKNVCALNPRGTLYDANNIKQILSMRDFMDSMRGSGMETGGPDAFGQKDRQAFANALDQIIARAQSEK